MKYILLKKEDNQVTKTEFTSQEEKETRLTGIHMCWENCAHACNCKKILSSANIPFTEYDFITSGCQIFNSDGVVLEGIVTKCKNYEEKHQPQKLSFKEQQRIAEIKKAMLMTVFNAETLDEALDTEEYLQKKGFLAPPSKVKTKSKKRY